MHQPVITHNTQGVGNKQKVSVFLHILVDDDIYHNIHFLIEIYHFNMMYIAVKQLGY